MTSKPFTNDIIIELKVRYTIKKGFRWHLFSLFKLAVYSSVAISYCNNFMIDRTLRQTHSAPLSLVIIMFLLRCCLQIKKEDKAMIYTQLEAGMVLNGKSTYIESFCRDEGGGTCYRGKIEITEPA